MKLFTIVSVLSIVAGVANADPRGPGGQPYNQGGFNMTPHPVYCCTYNTPNHSLDPTVNVQTHGSREQAQANAREQDRLNAIHGMSPQARANAYKAAGIKGGF